MVHVSCTLNPERHTLKTDPYPENNLKLGVKGAVYVKIYSAE
jgi:hypothetical protein